MTQDNQPIDSTPVKDSNSPASDNSISRKEFVRIVLKRGAIAGALLSAPKILDKFLVPPASAMASTVVMGHLT